MAVFIAAFFVIENNIEVVRISMNFIKVDIIHYYISGWLYIIIYYSVYLTVTIVFYILADFGLEARTNHVKPEISQESV